MKIRVNLLFDSIEKLDEDIDKIKLRLAGNVGESRELLQKKLIDLIKLKIEIETELLDTFEFYNVKKASAILSEQLNNIDVEVFVDYVGRYPVQIIRRRIGFFLEKLGVLQKTLNRIDSGQKGYSFLYDTDSKKGKANKKWRIIING